MGPRAGLLCISALLALCCTAHASRVSVVVGEPFGSFGTMMPAGHAGLLLEDYCADTPTSVRFCQPGERPGVVVSRYHDLRHPAMDWLAFPLSVFLYGTDDPANAPAFVTAKEEQQLRERYRIAHLQDVTPSRLKHGEPVPPPYGDWEEGIGAAFDRQLFLYSIAVSADDEAAIAATLNASSNHRLYRLHGANCADFAAGLLAIAIPGVDRNGGSEDFWLMSPKQLARNVSAYAAAHPEANLQVYDVPQLPGTLRRSRPTRGAAETFLKTKRYATFLAVTQPELLLADWIVYERRGRWTLGQNAQAFAPLKPLSTDPATPFDLQLTSNEKAPDSAEATPVRSSFPSLFR